MTSGVWGHLWAFWVNGEKQVHLQCFGSSSPACISIPLLLICMFCSLNYRCTTRQGRCWMYLPSNAGEVNSVASATEPWLLPETVLFGVFFLRGFLIPSLLYQTGQEPVGALNPVCCWMVSHQTSRASQRQGGAWHLRSLLNFVPLATKWYAQHLVLLISFLSRGKNRACNSADHREAFSFNSPALFPCVFESSAVTTLKYEKHSQEIPLAIVAVGSLLGEAGLHYLSDVSPV